MWRIIQPVRQAVAKLGAVAGGLRPFLEIPSPATVIASALIIARHVPLRFREVVRLLRDSKEVPVNFAAIVTRCRKDSARLKPG
jgi:hypothetical protein